MMKCGAMTLTRVEIEALFEIENEKIDTKDSVVCAKRSVGEKEVSFGPF